MARLKDKVTLITGGAYGIGRATGKLFLEEGAKAVVLVDISEEGLDEAKQELSPLGEVITIQADVSDKDDVENFVNTTKEKYGRIDVFFPNAGIEGDVAPIPQQTLDNYEKVMNVNVRGTFLGLQYVLPIMMEQKEGSIINMSSVAGLGGSPGVAPYVTSKHAVTGLTKSAALEAAGYNVRVNSVHPSPVETRMMRSLEAGFNPDDADAAKEQLTAGIPLGRYGESEEIAQLVLFLASDESQFITGVQYRIDGGMGAS